jgi:hypothetical protein
VICRVFQKGSRNKDVLVSPSEEAITNNEIDRRSISFPTSMQFSMGPEDFSVDLSALCPFMDPVMPFYSTIDASSLVALRMPPMASMGTMDIDGI